MSKFRKALSALALTVLVLGPSLGLPSLSAHQPTLSAPSAPASHGSDTVQLPIGLVALAGAIQVKDTGSIAAKFRTRASAAAPDYAAGVQSAGQAWESNTRAAVDSYQQGVQEAIARGAFARGVAAAGASKYTENAVKLGTQRYPTGVQNAEGAYARGVGRFLDVIKGLNLPARGPKGSPANMERANVVARALRAAKVGA